MQAIVQILQPLAGPKVGEAVRKTVNEIFGVFAQSMAAAFQKFMRLDGTFPPRLGEQLYDFPIAPAAWQARSCVVPFLHHSHGFRRKQGAEKCRAECSMPLQLPLPSQQWRQQPRWWSSSCQS